MTPVKSVTPIVAVASFDPSATLVAVMVTTPAAVGAVNVTGFPEVLVVGANPTAAGTVEVNDHTTPAFVLSLVSVAIAESVCEVVRPPRRGDTLTVMLDPPEDAVVADAIFEKLLTLPQRRQLAHRSKVVLYITRAKRGLRCAAFSLQ